LFGQQRLDAVLSQHRYQSLDAQCQCVVDALQRFGGKQFNDDVTLVGIGFAG
jgi:serine phosphatase RsbU (regulator of sigma subunit)